MKYSEYYYTMLICDMQHTAGRLLGCYTVFMKILPAASIGLGRKLYQKYSIQAIFLLISHITRIHQKTAVKLYIKIGWIFDIFSISLQPYHSKAIQKNAVIIL